jgi:uncharacterized protein with FMN-binding domain
MNRNLKYLLIIIALTASFAGYKFIKFAGFKAYQEVKQNSVKMETLANGSYTGKFNVFNNIPLASVQFKIEEGNINDFSISYLLSSPFKDVKSSVKDSVRKSQSVHFDAVSGATRSSFYVKAAILNAILENNKDERNH